MDDTIYVIINDEQDITIEELEKKLKKISAKYRETIYKKGEFQKALNEYGFYAFIHGSEDCVDFSYIMQDLRYADIVAYRANEDELEEMSNDFDKKNRKQKRNKNINNEIPESIFDQILSIDKIKKYDDYFVNKIVGQDYAIDKIKEQLINLTYKIEHDNRPAGIFFFVGPTGVGKTEIFKQLNKFLYEHDEINRFDMSEYKSEVAIQKLIGAPNGYVGYEEGGVLINKMKENPNTIVLFDEIEKADKTVFDIFLQILDEGFVTSNMGEKVYFKNNFVIFTSNIGANQIDDDMNYDEIKSVIQEEINDFFTYKLGRPEILGRIGKENIIEFNLINKKEDLYKILDIHFDKFKNELSKLNISIQYPRNKVYDAILIDADITKGARDIRNEFDQFKRHFNKALFDKDLTLNQLKNKNIDFEYDNVKVIINNIK